MNLLENIEYIGKLEKVNHQQVIRDYFIGIIASIANEVNDALRRPDDVKPVILGGISLRKGHIPSSPRYTPDIDFESNAYFYDRNDKKPIINYKEFLKEVASLLSKKIKSIYGNSYEINPAVVKLIEPTDNYGNKFGSLKGKIVIPEFMGWKNIVIKNETSTKKKTTFLPTVNLDVQHNFIDKEELNLSQITVPALVNTLGNKVYSSLDRMSSDDAKSRFSRLKDVFDIWLIDKNANISVEDFNYIFSERIKVEKEKDVQRVLSLIQDLRKNREEVFRSIFSIIEHNIKSQKSTSDTEKMKRMTKGLIDSYNFPSSNELINNFMKYINLLEI